MLQINIFILLLVTATIKALPIANIHVKFVSRPHVYEHDITTDGDRTIFQKSFVSIGRRSIPKNSRQYGDHIYEKNLRRNSIGEKFQQYGKPENAESLWPVGVFIPPININDLGYSSQESRHMTPDYSNGLDYHDPFLLTGEKAAMAVKYLYGRGELFFDDYPHVRALLRNQEERRLNGLHGNVLSSLRRSSPFYRKVMK